MILKCTLGENFDGIDRYATRAKDARLLASNFGGDTIAERMREATALRSSRPNLKKVVGHIILSHDPELTDLTDEQWLVALEIAKQEHDLRDAAFCAVLHLEKRHRHLHLYYTRCRPDGSLVSDSQSFKKNEKAARRIEKELGLPPPTPVPKQERVGDRRSVDNATRRGRRKHQTNGELFMDLPELRTRIDRALAGSESVDKFNLQLAADGVDVKWSENLAGVQYKPTGATTWHKGSSLRRDLAAQGVMLVIERNAELRAAAKNAATAVVNVADDRAQSLIGPRVDRNLELDGIATAPGVTARALAPTEADAARAQAEAGPDPLDFLVPPEPVPTVLDDIAVAPIVAPTTAPTDSDEEVLARSQRADADDERARLSAEMRKLNAEQLIELRNVARRPLDEAIIMAALLEKLLALALRLLTFGGYKRSTPISDLLVSKQAVGQAAEGEISRRRRSATAAERLRNLAAHEAALKARQLELDAQETAAELALLYTPTPTQSSAAGRLRELATAEFDRAQSVDQKPTTTELKAEIDKLDGEIDSFESESQQAPVVAGLGLLSKVKFGSAAARARADAEHEAARGNLRRARQRRERAAVQLAQFFDAIERVVAQQQAKKDAKAAEAGAILADEAEALKIEICDRVPEWRAAIEAAANRERIAGVDREVDKDAAEGVDEAEAERLRLRRLANKGG